MKAYLFLFLQFAKMMLLEKHCQALLFNPLLSDHQEAAQLFWNTFHSVSMSKYIFPQENFNIRSHISNLWKKRLENNTAYPSLTQPNNNWIECLGDTCSHTTCPIKNCGKVKVLIKSKYLSGNVTKTFTFTWTFIGFLETLADSVR